jgi:hypothetical protein
MQSDASYRPIARRLAPVHCQSALDSEAPTESTPSIGFGSDGDIVWVEYVFKGIDLVSARSNRSKTGFFDL